MKKATIFTFLLLLVLPLSAGNGIKGDENQDHSVTHLTTAEFKAQIFDFETQKEWKYKGDTPAIVDFYADWCGPCKRLAPELEKIQKSYKNKVRVYKINTEKERGLAQAFGIRSIPTLLFIPKDGKPTVTMGYRTQSQLEEIIKEILKVEKP